VFEGDERPRGPGFEVYETRQGLERAYWIWFDVPQIDGDGDGPYTHGTVLGRYLEVLPEEKEEEGAVFLVTFLAGRLLHYEVMDLVDTWEKPYGRAARWVLVLPHGVVRAVERPQNGEQVLKSAADGGPSYLAPFTEMTGGMNPCVITLVDSGMGQDVREIFEDLGFREGDPEGYTLISAFPGFVEGYRRESD
jgi:hypothetical protein